MSDLRLLQSGLSGQSCDHVLNSEKRSLLTSKIRGRKIESRNKRDKHYGRMSAEMRLL